MFIKTVLAILAVLTVSAAPANAHWRPATPDAVLAASLPVAEAAWDWQRPEASCQPSQITVVPVHATAFEDGGVPLAGLAYSPQAPDGNACHVLIATVAAPEHVCSVLVHEFGHEDGHAHGEAAYPVMNAAMPSDYVYPACQTVSEQVAPHTAADQREAMVWQNLLGDRMYATTDGWQVRAVGAHLVRARRPGSRVRRYYATTESSDGPYYTLSAYCAMLRSYQLHTSENTY